MADWRQIQARIRKAKNSADAKTKLSELYQRTRDAMVAWELGAVEEKAERNDDAVKWYTIAAERFRRADWKKKAEEALTRLGAPLPVPGAKPSPEPAFATSAAGSESAESTKESGTATHSDETADYHPQLAHGEILPKADADDGEEDEVAASSESKTQAGTESQDSADPNGKKKRRRGRRGGRGRRRKAAAAPGLPSKSFANAGASAPATPSTVTAQPRTQTPKVSVQSPPSREEIAEPVPVASASSHEAEHTTRSERSAPMLPSERTAHGRAGDPALASRMSKLESMLRRLVASPLHRLDEADAAPAGPGVFLLSDSDQITSYYVEACQTLRVGLGNLARGSGRSTTKPLRGGRPAFDSGLKAKLAEHLGIGEAKVSQYLNDHCVVRWIQLDDDAPHLAHFAIGVLRTPLNVD